MAKLSFELTTPERLVLKDEFDAVTLPTQEGEITVLPGHIPLVANLASGVITVITGGTEWYIAVSGGFVEVQPGSAVIVLADTAERAEELDYKSVQEARDRAAALLAGKRHADQVATAAAAALLAREMARLKVVEKYRRTRHP